MLENLSLPDGVQLVRTTAEFTPDSVPAGLLRAHRVASGVWGCLRVRSGTVTFVVEATSDRRILADGDMQVIEPGVTHHVEPGVGAVFVVEFYE